MFHSVLDVFVSVLLSEGYERLYQPQLRSIRCIFQKCATEVNLTCFNSSVYASWGDTKQSPLAEILVCHPGMTYGILLLARRGVKAYR